MVLILFSVWGEKRIAVETCFSTSDIRSVHNTHKATVVSRRVEDRWAYLYTWWGTLQVGWGPVVPIRSWGRQGALPSLGREAHAGLSSPGRISQTKHASCPYSRSAACLQLWNLQISHSLWDALTFLKACWMLCPLDPHGRATAPRLWHWVLSGNT